MFHGRDAVSKKQLHSAWMASRGFLIKLTEDSAPVVIDSVKHLEAFLLANSAQISNKKRGRSSDTDPSPSTSHTSKLRALNKRQPNPAPQTQTSDSASITMGTSAGEAL